MDKQKTISKKRGTIATKIIIVVALAVIITNTICLTLIGNNARRQLRQSTQNAMLSMVDSVSKLIHATMREREKE